MKKLLGLFIATSPLLFILGFFLGFEMSLAIYFVVVSTGILIDIGTDLMVGE